MASLLRDFQPLQLCSLIFSRAQWSLHKDQTRQKFNDPSPMNLIFTIQTKQQVYQPQIQAQLRYQQQP